MVLRQALLLSIWRVLLLYHGKLLAARLCGVEVLAMRTRSQAVRGEVHFLLHGVLQFLLCTQSLVVGHLVFRDLVLVQETDVHFVEYVRLRQRDLIEAL